MLQNLVIAVAISLVVGFSAGYSASNTVNSNKAKTLDIQRQADIIVYQDALSKQQKDNDDKIARINKVAAEEASKSNKLYSDYSKLLLERNRLRVKGTTCDKEGAATSPSNNVDAEAGQCTISKEVAGRLLDLAKRADDLRIYAETAHEYAKAIEDQRQRISQENNKNE